MEPTDPMLMEPKILSVYHVQDKATHDKTTLEEPTLAESTLNKPTLED